MRRMSGRLHVGGHVEARVGRCLLALLVLVPLAVVVRASPASAYPPEPTHVSMVCNLGISQPGQHQGRGPSDSWEWWAYCFFNPGEVPGYWDNPVTSYDISHLETTLLTDDGNGDLTGGGPHSLGCGARGDI